MRYGHLEALGAHPVYPQYEEVHCDCGETRWILRARLISGHTQSCGCRKQQARARFKERLTKHGQSRSPLYVWWSRHKVLGHLCERWQDFLMLMQDIGTEWQGKPVRPQRKAPFGPDNFQWTLFTHKASPGEGDVRSEAKHRRSRRGGGLVPGRGSAVSLGWDGTEYPVRIR